MESGLFINGEWIERKERIKVINPYNGKEIGSVAKADKEDVCKAVNAAKKAFTNFKNSTMNRRAEYLRIISKVLAEREDEIATVISKESGKAIRFSRGEVSRATETFRFAADEADKLSGETVPMDAARTGKGRIGFYMRVPVGVVAAITPFNFPLNLPAHKIAPAIAAGDTIIWKPSSETPLTAVLLTQIIEDIGIPAGVVNLVFGSGGEIGGILTSHDDVRLVSFTGSLEVGKEISKSSGIKKNLLELGSNSALVIDREVEDLEEIVERSIVGAFANSGQVCISIQRIYVHESLFDDFCSLFVERSKKIKIGNPLEPDVLYGPMITEKEAIRAETWIEEAIKGGAKTLLRGKRNGSVIPPTILTDVTGDMKVMEKEVFAPVVSIVKFREFERAIEEVNDSIYGLNAGIYTPRIKNALKAIRECEVGSVIINDIPTFRVDQMPYGGVKMSGLGREGPPYAISEYTEIRFVALR